MGRVKLEIKRIENNANRQVTFSKRRNGLIKKAYKLSILCDIDIALIIFSPYGRVTHFSGRTRIEDVLCRYINLPHQEIDKAVSFPEPPYRKSIHKEYLLSTLQQLKSENDRLANPPGDVNPEIEELQQEVNRLQQQLQMAEEQIRTYEPDPLNMTSVEEIESSEKHLVNTLTLVMQRKEYLLSNHLSGYDQSVIQEKSLWQGMPTSFEDVERFPEGGQNHPQIFDASAPLDQLRDLQSTMYVYDPLSPGTSSNADPQNRGEYHVTNQTDANIPSWPEGYTLYSLIHEQHEMVGRPDMADGYDATWAGEHSYSHAPTQQ